MTPSCLPSSGASTKARGNHTGLTITGCQQADAVIDTLLRDHPELLGAGAEADLRTWLVEAAMDVEELRRSCRRERVNAGAVPALAVAWIAGHDIATLRAEHTAALGVSDAIGFSSVLDSVIGRDLAWVLSSLLELLASRFEESWEPTPELAALPAMAKHGLPTPSACFAATIGIRSRTAAQQVGALYEATGAPGDLGRFLGWLNEVDPEVLTMLDQDTIKRLLDRAAGLDSPQAGLALLAKGSGALRSPLRGMAYEGRWPHVARLRIGSQVVLERERTNPHDPNAILVRDNSGAALGYVAREVARNIAPLLDIGEVDDVQIRGQLVQRKGTDPDQPGTATIELSIISST
jgi:hypothetical protein